MLTAEDPTGAHGAAGRRAWRTCKACRSDLASAQVQMGRYALNKTGGLDKGTPATHA